MRKFGKLPARPGSVKLKFSAFFDAKKLPTPPKKFGHYGLGQGLNWGSLGNDKWGDCVLAGAAHETMVWTHRSGTGQPVPFNDQVVLGDYSAITGFDGTEATDQGTDMQEAASYRRKTGVMDATGHRHKIDAYVALRPGSVNDLAVAAYLGGAVGVGLRFPTTASDQFDNGDPWTVDGDPDIDGGHYVACVGRNSSGNFLVVTWGRLHAMSPEFYRKYSDEAVAYLSLENLNQQGLSPDGFAADDLKSKLAALAA